MKKNIAAKEALTLDVKDYTHAVSGLLEHLEQIFPVRSPDNDNPRINELYISDVVDDLGRQCVDLVQEGGGVHGIALAGYTYILEKMGITFSKMAGTSAGAINTMLLGGTLTSGEIEWLQSQKLNAGQYSNYDFTSLDKDDFRPTRSENLLGYLAGKDLSDLVDGHPGWRKIILKLFVGKVKLEGVKREKYRLLALIAGSAISFLVLLFASLALAFSATNTVQSGWRIAIAVSAVAFTVSIGLVAARLLQARLLWLLAEKLGINPGKDFYDWVEGKLGENKVNTIDSLREKLELETIWFKEYYHVPVKENLSTVMPDTDINFHGQGEKLSNEWYNQQVTAIEKEVDALEQKAGAGNDDISDETDMLWDRLVRVASNLPAGDCVMDKLAEKRVPRLVALFSRLVAIQDNNCGYTSTVADRQRGVPPTLGPYTHEMTIITTDITNELKVEFPAMHNLYWGSDYTMSPACYVRASMAIPFFFTPFKVPVPVTRHAEMEKAWDEFMKIEKRRAPKATWSQDDDATLFVDGGAISNFPINIYATPEMPLPRKPTIGIQLEYEDESLSKSIQTTLGEVGSIVSTVRYFYDRDFIAKHDMYKRTVRAIDTGQIHWLNFSLRNKDKMELFFRGALAATIFLTCTHNDLDQHYNTWTHHLLQLGDQIPCPPDMQGRKKKSPGMSIYENSNEMVFRQADLENPRIRFSWPNYKRERILALSQLKHQRNILKSFPKQ